MTRIILKVYSRDDVVCKERLKWRPEYHTVKITKSVVVAIIFPQFPEKGSSLFSQCCRGVWARLQSTGCDERAGASRRELGGNGLKKRNDYLDKIPI